MVDNKVLIWYDWNDRVTHHDPRITKDMRFRVILVLAKTLETRYQLNM
jgi:hypothetical protein